MLTIRVEHVFLPTLEGADLLVRIASSLDAILERMGSMQEQLDDLRAAVQGQTDVVASAVTAFQGLADKVEEAADDPDEVRDLAATIRQNSQALAAAIPANTPAAPPAPAPQGAQPGTAPPDEGGLTNTGTVPPGGEPGGAPANP